MNEVIYITKFQIKGVACIPGISDTTCLIPWYDTAKLLEGGTTWEFQQEKSIPAKGESALGAAGFTTVPLSIKTKEHKVPRKKR